MSHLVIVDMQPRFEAANCANTTENIIKLVKAAKKNRWRLSVLEYHGFGPTNENIVNAVGRYRKAKYITKFDDDGSSELAEAWRIKGPVEDFLVCGVNYTACVARTALGINRLNLGAARIIQDACNQPSEWVAAFWFRPSIETIKRSLHLTSVSELVS